MSGNSRTPWNARWHSKPAGRSLYEFSPTESRATPPQPSLVPWAHWPSSRQGESILRGKLRKQSDDICKRLWPKRRAFGLARPSCLISPTVLSGIMPRSIIFRVSLPELGAKKSAQSCCSGGDAFCPPKQTKNVNPVVRFTFPSGKSDSEDGSISITSFVTGRYSFTKPCPPNSQIGLRLALT